MERLVWNLIVVVSAISNQVNQVKGHGRLVEPPSRSSAWRFSFDTPKNYNDHEIYCGGWSRQHQTNNGKCGVCGDAWDLPSPRPNEGGGEFGTGVIVRTYRLESIIDIGVELTANHQGFFEFSLCPQNNPTVPETEECFNRNILQRADGQGPRYYPGPGSGIVFTERYMLPSGLTCTQCVLRWRYVAGNNWGTCANGTSMMGCGPQEEFRACSDISITKDGIAATTALPPRRTSTTTAPRRTTTTAPTTTTTDTTVSKPSDTNSSSAAGPYAGIIIAFASLLFAILFILGIILYFYRGQDLMKQFLQKHWKNKPDPQTFGLGRNLEPRIAIVSETDKSNPPPLQPRKIFPRNLPLTISEPIQVAINGIPVDRDSGHVSESRA